MAATAKPTKAPVESPTKDEGPRTKDRISPEDMYQVVLHNDDYNEAMFVVRTLVRIFRHTPDLAYKIMMEAHTHGRAIAQVEGETEAKKHCAQLQSAGLGATVEMI